jgi:hypothetical protein
LPRHIASHSSRLSVLDIFNPHIHMTDDTCKHWPSAPCTLAAY